MACFFGCDINLQVDRIHQEHLQIFLVCVGWRRGEIGSKVNQREHEASQAACSARGTKSLIWEYPAFSACIYNLCKLTWFVSRLKFQNSQFLIISIYFLKFSDERA